LYSTTIDHSQAEVAKTFYWREFGNGSANGNASYADGSMLSTSTDDIAYVMDDGLTSLASKDAESLVHATAGNGLSWSTSSVTKHFTFIGTGLSVSGPYNPSPSAYGHVTTMVAQNLPYGTHILTAPASSAYNALIDGIEIASSNNSLNYAGEYHIHQPKMPPIPEDAVVIADYMLMADFVAQTSEGVQYISKGVRSNSVSRDVFVDGASFDTMVPTPTQVHGLRLNSTTTSASATDIIVKLPSFGTQYVVRGFTVNARNQLYVDGVSKTQSFTGTDNGSASWLTTSLTLGVYDFQINTKSGQTANLTAVQVVSPIHTSSHYQTFETPFLHELVGGDRNMEQTNLVVTPDGKTWDEVTRDVSYIGKCIVSANSDTDNDDGGVVNIMDEWRGTTSGEYNPNFNKDFAIAYDRMICLVAGQYEIYVQTLGNNTNTSRLTHNGSTISTSHVSNTSTNTDMGASTTVKVSLKRGDYIQIVGQWYQNESYNNFTITRL
jgi:hypothetical protein